MNASSNEYSALVVSRDQNIRDWLADGLEQAGVGMVTADPPTLEKVLQIIDLAPVNHIFVFIGGSQEQRDAALIEGIVAAKPMMPVIAVGETTDQHTLLLAMRAGARDFLSLDSRSGDLIALINRIRPREAGVGAQNATHNGKVYSIIDGRPGYGASFLATHLALEMQRSADTLLIDLGVPQGDSSLYLGLEIGYSFLDALRSIRRLDSKLIETGFPRHRSGLTLLSLPERSWGDEEISTADVYLLLCALKKHFPRIVVNLGGLPQSELLLLMVNNTDRGILLAEQNLLSCRGNALVLEYLREQRADTTKLGLVIDRSTRKIPLEQADIARTFGLQVIAALPSSGLSRIGSINAKSPISVQYPDDDYTRAVAALAKTLASDTPGEGLAKDSGLTSLRGLLGKLVPGRA